MLKYPLDKVISVLITRNWLRLTLHLPIFEFGKLTYYQSKEYGDDLNALRKRGRGISLETRSLQFSNIFRQP